MFAIVNNVYNMSTILKYNVIIYHQQLLEN